MGLAGIAVVPGVIPIVEIGLGDTRIETGQARWDIARWDTPPDATWAGSQPMWVDVTCDVHDIETGLGRARATDRFGAGTATITADNTSGWADLDPDDVANLTLRPGRQCRVGVDVDGIGRRWLWRGYLDAVVPLYHPAQSDVVTVEAICALGEAGRARIAKLAAPVGAGERGSQRIKRILDAGRWPSNMRRIDETATVMIATQLGAAAVDLLTVTADSEGGAVYGDIEGRVAFRGRDWQTFHPAEPNDGTIGNGGVVPSPGEPAYLTSSTTAVVLSPDNPNLDLPNQFVISYTGRGPAGSGSGVLASQYPFPAGDGLGDYSWYLSRSTVDGSFSLTLSPDGFATVAHIVPARPIDTAVSEHVAVAVTLDDGTGLRRLTSLASADGVAWTELATTTAPTSPVHRSADVLRVGNLWGNFAPWGDRLERVELRAGLDPAGGDILWRFDAGERPAGQSFWIDPRGREWQVTDPAAITPAVEPTVADVCPSGWEISHRRTDIVTQIILGRDDAGATEQRVYNDAAGQALYGIESPHELTDLVAQADSQLTLLAARLFRTRGYKVAPRVEAVTLDAATSIAARDLMATADVFKPSRYRCRLREPRGLIFDREYFVTGIEHRISPDGWTCRMALDLSSPWQAVGARWDQGYWDQSLWAAATFTQHHREAVPA